MEETLSRAQARCKACGASGLDVERTEWLYEYLKRRPDTLRLDGPGYYFMSKMYGFSRSDLDRAVATLRDRGVVRVEELHVELVEEATACSPA